MPGGRLLNRLSVFVLKVSGRILSTLLISIFWILSPLVKIKVGGLVAQRIGHLALNTDLFFRRQQIYGKPERTRHLFIAGRVANRQLLGMWKRHATIIESRLLRGLFHYSEDLWKRTPFYQPMPMNTNEYREFNQAEPTLSFTSEEKEQGERFLKQFGIRPGTDWFVCVFARDPDYLKKEFGHQRDWSYHDDRNADIDTFKPAIDYIVQRGGFVFRMGHHVNKPLLHSSSKVIDYATHFRDDFMDIYLAAKCRFFLGTTSGICDVPLIFDTPRLTTNAAPPTDRPIGKHCLYIPKKVRRQGSGDYVSFRTIVEETRSQYESNWWNAESFAAAGYRYEDNSGEEILAATREMMERLNGEFRLTEEDEILQSRFFRLFSADHWCAGVKTPMGRDFLRQHKHLLDS